MNQTSTVNTLKSIEISYSNLYITYIITLSTTQRQVIKIKVLRFSFNVNNKLRLNWYQNSQSLS